MRSFNHLLWIAEGGSGLLVAAANGLPSPPSKSFCESRRGYDSGGRAGGVGRRAVCGAAAMNTEVGRARLGAVCGGDEYGGRAAGVGGRFAGFPWSGRVVFGGRGGLHTALNC
jgi:hypothetical protein